MDTYLQYHDNAYNLHITAPMKFTYLSLWRDYPNCHAIYSSLVDPSFLYASGGCDS